MKAMNPGVLLLVALLAACASKPAKNEGAVQESKKEAVVGEVVGKPAPGSKFAKLKIGMTLKQVVELIGPPTSQWHRPTAKAHIPFYRGDDRWVEEYAYSKEGQLTFNAGGDQVLVHIAVNKEQ